DHDHVLEDPREAYDRMRGLPLAEDELGRAVLCRHADVVAAANDPATYSSRVSRFLQVPNGLDGEEHLAARALLDPFFAPSRMASLEPAVAAVARELVDAVPYGSAVDAVGDLGARFAVRAQSVWLGWPRLLEDELLRWMDDNHAATRSGDADRTRAVAERFDAIIRRLVTARRGQDAPDDVTTELVRLRDGSGSRIPDEVLVSVLRNWTGGDLGSMALAAGVVVHRLATDPQLQDRLRTAPDKDVDAALDEILRIDDPFVANRRVLTTDVIVGGCPVAHGRHVVLNWTAANRDPAAFPEPERFDPEANAARNLVYGTGPHACPGRPLATLELRVLVRTLLSRGRLSPAAQPAERERPPLGGFSRVPVVLTPHPSVGSQAAPQALRARVITVSDEVAAGLDEDRGGLLAERLLAELGADTRRVVVGDDAGQIASAVVTAVSEGARVVVTCGGTGIGPSDRTSDVVSGLLTYEIPGIAEEIRRRGLAHSAPSLVSRGIAGVIRRDGSPATFVLCAPGSRGGVRDALGVVGPLLGYIVEQLDGAGHA
ncbi:MAG TPA: cytochrome P450, partial [Propionibacteriaceae bacterium]|nr:cytochrome P450 [Propionibacteriaceae bacterium]